jgi:hypothetical protein
MDPGAEQRGAEQRSSEQWGAEHWGVDGWFGRKAPNHHANGDDEGGSDHDATPRDVE